MALHTVNAAPLPTDSVFEPLASDHRRQIVQVLLTIDNPVTETELATLTAERMCGKVPRNLDEAEYNRIAIKQHHVHLPKLANCGLIDWDRERHVITGNDRIARTSELIGAIRPTGLQRDGTGKEN